MGVFGKALKEFKTLKERAYSTCQPVFPCSKDGTLQYEESSQDCYSQYIGCGYKCLDGLSLNNTTLSTKSSTTPSTTPQHTTGSIVEGEEEEEEEGGGDEQEQQPIKVTKKTKKTTKKKTGLIE